MLPKISMLARLTREPEIKYLQDGKAVCKLGLVSSEKYGDKETQLFIDGTAWGKTAEFINSIRKGQRIYVFGKLQTESWEKDGQKHSKISMTIESFEYVEKRGDQQQSNYSENQNSSSHQQTDSSRPEYNAPQHQSYSPPPEHGYNEEDEIPF